MRLVRARSCGLLLPVLLASAGCATAPRHEVWGAGVTPTPGWARVGAAASSAVLAPQTWAPVAVALMLQIDDLDARLSDWASEETPLFGSQADASRASDRLQTATEVAWVLTALATPSGDEAGEWLIHKAQGMAVGLVARGLTYETVRFLKLETDRQRPDGSDDMSFPSGHAASASVYASLAARYTQSLRAPARVRTMLQLADGAAAAACAWARVEGHHHYPSDVLVGLALGHFFAAFVDGAFMGGAPSEHVQLHAGGRPGGAAIWLRLEF